MTLSDWIIACTTLVGPILAVQAQKWIERNRESKTRKSHVFHTLMATRGARLSGEHVRALNMIDLTFYGEIKNDGTGRTKGDQSVLDAWHEYHDHLCTPLNPNATDHSAIYERRDDLFINLLYAMATDLGFRFDRVQLKKSWYTPQAHNEIESQQAELMRAAIEVLAGRSPVKIAAAESPGR